MARLSGKKILITGAGGALGRATALQLAAADAAVACCDINLTRAQQTAEQIEQAGGKAVALAGDVADADSCSAMIDQAAVALNGLNVLFNNAGILLPDDVGAVDTPLASWEKTLAVNLTGVFLCCKYGIPKLEAAGGGSVINTASIVAQVGSVFPQLAYTASKGGVLAMTRELAVMYARQNIRFNALCPGPVNTELTAAFFSDEARWRSRQAFMPQGRLGTPEEIANAVIFLASDESSFVNGTTFTVDGAITAAYVASNLE
jgi:NAD(P)-dependent dehydrogenase (short-subunit alcohol dehydrogenase family)